MSVEQFMRERKNPSFLIEKEGILFIRHVPVYKRSPSFYLSSVKLAGSGTVFKVNLLPRFQRASPSTSLDTMSKQISRIIFCFFDYSKYYTWENELSMKQNII